MSAVDPLAEEVRNEQAAEYQWERRKLSDFAFALLYSTDNDVDEAEKLLDEAINLLCEGGLLQTWRYRIVLEMIREGL